jgi:penicillin-binding protein 1B
MVRAVVWLAALGLGISLGLHTATLDRVVRERFEGNRFRVPSRVYSAPPVVYPGLDWRRADLPGSLARLGYREVRSRSPLTPGRFSWSGSQLTLYRRAFSHPSRPEPALRVELRLEGDRVASMVDSAAGRELRYLILEPEPLGSYFGPAREQRELVVLERLPPHLVNAVLAVEDRRFFSHAGVDVWRVLGALWVNLREGRVVQGGSTLTQQLVKNFFLTPERSLERKVQEAWMALIVEARYEKPAILETYLNEIYLGQRGATAVHGVGEGSRHYFGKSAEEVTVGEAALMAAIINSPNGRSPYRYPEEAEARRNLVLELMYEGGHLDGERLAAAKNEPLGLAPVTPEPREARWFLDFLRRQLPEFYDNATLTRDGLRIYSTLDLGLQRLAARAVREGLESLERDFAQVSRGSQPLEACLVALRPQTGEVLALVGGRDYGRSQFDRCTQAHRQAGSAFKPFVYAAALEPVPGGPTITLASPLDDTPLTVSTPTGDWSPENYDKTHHGEVDVEEAVARSLNVATARLGQAVGPARIAELARRVGIESRLPEVPALSLGAADLSPLELARAYATLANGGVRPEIRSFEDVVDAGDERIEQKPVQSERVLDPGTVFLVTRLLEGVVNHGTGHGVRTRGIRGPVAGKTGTTNDEYDAWFAGFTPELAVVVWVGYDEPRSIGLTGSQAALPIWARFLRDATGGTVAGRFVPPPEVMKIDVDPASGARALVGCPRREPVWFVRGTEPQEVCPGYRITRPHRDGDDPAEPAGRTWVDRLLDRWVGHR